MTPLDKLTEAAAKHIAYVGEPDAAERHVAKLTLAAIQAALPEGHYLGGEGVVRATEVGGDPTHPKALFVIEPVETTDG